MRNITRAVLGASLLVAALPLRLMAQDEMCHSLHFRSNFRINGAQRHLDIADKTTYPDIKRRESTETIRMLTESLNQGAAEPFTSWYFMGRAYLHLGDLRGADTSFTRAEALANGDQGCIAEMRRLRKNTWIPIQQDAVGMIQAQNYDSALALLRKSNLIYREDPGGYMNMASAFLSKNMEDSATAAFIMAAHAGTDPDRASIRTEALLNAARMRHRADNYPAAESLYRQYIALKPNDFAARGALATVLSNQHRNVEAAAAYDSMLAKKDSLDYAQLFDIGVSLFNLAQADSVPADSVQRKATFHRGATAFEAALAKNAASREALYNLTNCYIAAGEMPEALQAAKRLVGVDSLNRTSLTLLAGGYQEIMKWNARRDSILRSRRDSLPQAQQYNATARAYRDSLLKTLMRRDSLPFDINISQFSPRDSTVQIRGVVRNLKAAERPGFNLILEFLNAAGAVVTTERVEIPTLNALGSPGQSYDFNIQARGRGIIAYRYKIG